MDGQLIVKPAVISDEDWSYACTIGCRTQDNVQRNLLEIIARLVGRTLPMFPPPEKRTPQPGKSA